MKQSSKAEKHAFILKSEGTCPCAGSSPGPDVSSLAGLNNTRSLLGKSGPSVLSVVAGCHPIHTKQEAGQLHVCRASA